MSRFEKQYSICVIDIGSPRLGNLGWFLYDAVSDCTHSGQHLDDLVEPFLQTVDRSAVLLGLEAPLFVPIRADIMLATKARAGESPRPWSAGAGAQVLAMNLPIMTYFLQKLSAQQSPLVGHAHADAFHSQPGEFLMFEALVSGSNKGSSHIDDAKIMVDYCRHYSDQCQLPPSILQPEVDTTYLNLAYCALLYTGFTADLALLRQPSPIYRPDYHL